MPEATPCPLKIGRLDAPHFRRFERFVLVGGEVEIRGRQPVGGGARGVRNVGPLMGVLPQILLNQREPGDGREGSDQDESYR